MSGGTAATSLFRACETGFLALGLPEVFPNLPERQATVAYLTAGVSFKSRSASASADWMADFSNDPTLTPPAVSRRHTALALVRKALLIDSPNPARDASRRERAHACIATLPQSASRGITNSNSAASCCLRARRAAASRSARGSRLPWQLQCHAYGRVRVGPQCHGRQPRSPHARRPSCCVACHRGPGVHAFNTFIGGFSPSRASIPRLATPGRPLAARPPPSAISKPATIGGCWKEFQIPNNRVRFDGRRRPLDAGFRLLLHGVSSRDRNTEQRLVQLRRIENR